MDGAQAEVGKIADRRRDEVERGGRILLATGRRLCGLAKHRGINVQVELSFKT